MRGGGREGLDDGALGKVAISVQLRRVVKRAAAAIAASLIGALAWTSPVFAQDATWVGMPTVTNPADGNFDFNANANWMPNVVPGSSTQTGTATFGATNSANISFSANSTTLSGFTFNTGASNYTFFTANDLTFVGAGISVNGGSATINNTFRVNFNNASTAGTATINNNNVLAFNNSATAGSSTIVNNDILQFFNGTSAGSSTLTNNNNTSFFATSTAGSANISNNSAFGFFETSTAGTATITNNNNGLIQFGQSGGTDTAGAGSAMITNNSGGLIQFFASTTAGSGSATITNSGILNNNVPTQSVTQFFDSSMAGNAHITNNAFGLTTFANASTAGSAIITNNGALINNVEETAATRFIDSSNAGSAHITNNAFGVTTFANASTAGGATITNSADGATQFGSPGGTDTASAGNAVITNNSGGMTQFFAHTTAGSATFTNNGFVNNNNALIRGTLVFANSSTAASANITNNSGFTVFDNTSTAGSAAITNNGALINNVEGTAVTGFMDSSNAGSAHITNNAFGVTLFANTSNAGSANITNNAGSLIQFGGFGGTDTSSANMSTITNNNGSVLFLAHTTAGGATITNNGMLSFGGNSDGGTAHLINGAGGTIDFSGSAGPNNDFRLGVGSLAGSGTFIVGAQQLVNVSSSLAFTSGAVYLVQVSGSNAGRINVAGTATLAGNVEVDVASRLTQKTTYTILSSSGLNGTSFGNVTVDFAGFASNPVLSIVGNNVELTLDAGLLSPFLPGDANANQVKVAGAIDNALLGGSNLPPAFNTLFGLSGSSLGNALTQISGETATGSQQTTFNAMGQFMGMMTDPFMGRGGSINGSSAALGFAEEASGYAASGKSADAFAMFTKAAPSAKIYEPRWNVWASAFGGSQSTSGNAVAGSNDTTSRIAGTAVGADYLLSPTTIAGFALAGGGTNFSVANGGTGRSDLFQAGAYLFHTSGAAYVSAALAYGWQDVTTNRIVTVAGLDQLRAQFNANAWSGRVEGGYRFVVPTWGGGFGITPYAAAQFVTFDLPAYAEQAVLGLNTFALSYGAHAATDPRSELGFRADKSWAMSDGILTLRGRLAWAHDYNPDRAISATFQTLPGASFVVNGAGMAADSVLTTASVEKRWANGWSAAATYEGEFSNVTSSYAGKGVVRYVW